MKWIFGKPPESVHPIMIRLQRFNWIEDSAHPSMRVSEDGQRWLPSQLEETL